MHEKDLFNDLRKRFKAGEIRTFLGYKQLLKHNDRNDAYYMVTKSRHLFEGEINDCLIEAEETLEHRNLIDILNEYV